MARRQIEEIYQLCIEHGHWMEDAPPSTHTTVRFGFVLRCARGCGTLRHLEIHPFTGVVTHSRYEQPPEYKEYKAGKSKGDWRLEDLKAKGIKKPRGLKAVS
jgi:hypothetical protein